MKFIENHNVLDSTESFGIKVNHIQAGETRFLLNEQSDMLDVVHQVKTTASFPVNVIGTSSATCASGTVVWAALLFRGNGELQRVRSTPSGCSTSTTTIGTWHTDGAAGFDNYRIKWDWVSGSEASASSRTIGTEGAWMTFASDTDFFRIGQSVTKSAGFLELVTDTLRISIQSITGGATITADVLFNTEAT